MTSPTMSDGDEAPKKLNPYVDCLVQYQCLLRPLLIIAAAPLVLFLAPICIFGRADRTALVSCHAAWIRYTTQGVRLPGRVVEKHDHSNTDERGTSYTYSIKVEYQVDDGGQYTREFHVPDAVWRSARVGSDLDLIILPGYPRSAHLSTTVQEVDPDLPPPYYEAGQWVALVVHYLWVGLFTPLGQCIDDIPFLWFAVAVLAGIPLLFLSTGFFWYTKCMRNKELYGMLYGATQTDRGSWSSAAAIVPKCVSYDEFCPEDKKSFLGTVPFLVLRFVWKTMVLLYWVGLGGGQLAWTPWSRGSDDSSFATGTTTTRASPLPRRRTAVMSSAA
jgi:Protein of unknown function (DUF3592)